MALKMSQGFPVISLDIAQFCWITRTTFALSLDFLMTYLLQSWKKLRKSGGGGGGGGVMMENLPAVSSRFYTDGPSEQF